LTEEEIREEVKQLTEELGLTEQQVNFIIEHIKKSIESGEAKSFYEKGLGGLELASLLGSEEWLEKWLRKEEELQELYKKIYRLLKIHLILKK